MNILTEQQKAWLAGFIDGEGFIGITFQIKKETKQSAPSFRYHPYLIITNTYKDIIHYVYNLIGEGKIYTLRNRNIKHKNAYQYKLTKMPSLSNLLDNILPYLRVKQIQCQLLIDYIKKRKSVKIITGRGHRGATSFSKEDNMLYKKLLVLNKRGL